MKKTKLVSRKFLLTLASNVVALAVMVGADNTTAQLVGVAAMIIINAVYVVIQGNIDKATLLKAAEAINDVIEDVVEDKPEIEDKEK